jgi:hypothetical protein
MRVRIMYLKANLGVIEAPCARLSVVRRGLTRRAAVQRGNNANECSGACACIKELKRF